MKEGERFDLATLDREIDAEGIGYSPSLARRRAMPPPVVVFLRRRDGWSLGATRRRETIARLTYCHDWALFARAPDWILRSMDEYQPPEET